MFSRIINKINSNKNMIAGFMICSMILSFGMTGCSFQKQNVVQVPELLEPVGANQSFRPTEKMQVGSIKLLYGKVVPDSYPVFSITDVSIKKYEISLGDYVEEGDVIAYCDTSEYDEQIDFLTKTINSLYEERSMKENLSYEVAHKLTLWRQACEDAGDPDGVNKYTTDINVELENRRFELELIDTKISNAINARNEAQNKKDKLTFTAPHSGYITYMADMVKSNIVPHGMNIAVISDSENVHVEIPNTNIHDFKFKDFKSTYTYVGGKMVNLEEMAYTPSEVSFAETNLLFPPIRYKAVPGMKLGDTVAIYYVKDDIKVTLAVANDSINYDNDEVYVYVKNSATDELVKKNITIGLRDENYTEVTSGLEEGEEVFYESTSPLPVKYEKHTVERGTYNLTFDTKNIEKTMTHYDIYTSNYNGEYNAPVHDLGQELKNGDVLYTIKSITGSAELEEARVNLSNLSNGHSQRIDELNAQQNALQEELSAAQNCPAPIATETDAMAMEEYLYHSERVQCDLNALDIQRQYEETSYADQYSQLSDIYNKKCDEIGDNGLITIYVDEDGYAGSFPIRKDSLVYKGTFITAVGHKSSDILRVVMNESTDDKFIEPANIGQKVQFKIEDGATFTGTCIGINGNADKHYLFTRDGKQYVTTSAPHNGMTQTSFFVKLDEGDTASITNAVASYNGTTMNDVITIPYKCVKEEIEQLTNEKKHYVWKISGNTLIKQYVNVFEVYASANGTALILSGLKEGDIIVVE
ncbi:MAG: efflux RND transporter periplasmic adaptor subunit [Eubacterium sp.]|nr:efflux RND transporter periplasmic adaptor subunit [Eubacterium sp.]